MPPDGDGQLRWASASDQLAQATENNQEILGQGPCMDATPSRRPCTTAAANASGGRSPWSWAQLQARSGLRVPVELGGGPIGTLEVFTTTLPGWDETKVSALQAYAG